MKYINIICCRGLKKVWAWAGTSSHEILQQRPDEGMSEALGNNFASNSLPYAYETTTCSILKGCTHVRSALDDCDNLNVQNTSNRSNATEHFHITLNATGFNKDIP